MIRVKLTNEQRQTLSLRARSETGRVSERIHFVLLSDRGYSPPEVANLYGYNVATVRHWLKQYLSLGIDGLYDDPRSGRPPKMTPKAQAWLESTLSKAPISLGVWATVWTLGSLAGLMLAVVGGSVHQNTVRRCLHRLDWRWRKPKHVSPRNEDPEAQAKLRAIEAAVQEVTDTQGEATPVFLAQDESTFSWLAVLRRMWMHKGQQSEIKTPGEPKKVSCFGALDLISGQWLYYFAPKAQAVYFQLFLEQLVAAYPDRLIYLLLDNATIHRRTKSTIRWFEQHPEVVPLWLPTYSCKLNPVERLWGEIKQRVAANHCYPSIESLQQALVDFFQHGLSSEKALQVAGKASPLQWAA